MTDAEYLKLLKQRIRTARLAANFSQDQMAELLGIGVRRYQRMESSTIVDFKVSTLLRVARVANVSMTDLMADASFEELGNITQDLKATRIKKNQSKV
jgi:transcriptional regulator with XRE-family HTH domain